MNVHGSWLESSCVGLKRFGKEQFVKRIKKCNPDAANVDEHHWVRPFPQTFLDAIENKTEFTQNTGYK